MTEKKCVFSVSKHEFIIGVSREVKTRYDILEVLDRLLQMNDHLLLKVTVL